MTEIKKAGDGDLPIEVVSRLWPVRTKFFEITQAGK
jgi:hypothetical protein